MCLRLSSSPDYCLSSCRPWLLCSKSKNTNKTKTKLKMFKILIITIFLIPEKYK